jgi:hypothetical protein
VARLLAQEEDAYARFELAGGLAAVAGRLEPAEASRVCAGTVRLLVQAIAQEKDGDARTLLVQGLAAMAGRVEPAEAARVCAEGARLLVQGLPREKDGTYRGLGPHGVIGMEAMAGRMEPAAAARVSAEIARLLAQEKNTNQRGELAWALVAVAGRMEARDGVQLLNQVLAREKDAWIRQHLATGLAGVAGRLEAVEAARVCAGAARLLTRTLAEEKEFIARQKLIRGLVAVPGMVEPAEAARLLNQVLAQTNEGNAILQLVAALPAVADRLGPTEAAHLLSQASAQAKGSNFIFSEPGKPTRSLRGELARVMTAVVGKLGPAKAAQLLNEALAREEDNVAREQLTFGLAAVAGWLEPAAAGRVCAEAARSLIPALDQGRDEDTRRVAAVCVAMLLQTLDSEGATRAARVLARRIVSDPDLFYYLDDPLFLPDMSPRVFHPKVLERIVTSAARPPLQQRAIAIAAAIGIAAHDSAQSFPFLAATAKPLPCRLSTEDLVELLKMPTCVREVRRVILDQLGNRYGRRFETHWDFVRFAQEQGLDLDFTTPPKRPDPKLPPLFQQ